MQIIDMQASMQENAHQHKQVVEEVDRLRIELQRISDDRDLRANQVWKYQSVCNPGRPFQFQHKYLFSGLKALDVTQCLVETFEKVDVALNLSVFQPEKCLNWYGTTGRQFQ